MGSDRSTHGRSSPINFDRLIGDEPEVKRVAEDAEIAATAGELVRRLRTTKAVTQSDLARRTGITQAHISELERGLGPNGPTVVTLARIVSELGDRVIFDTAGKRAARNADQISDAQSWILELLDKALQEPPALGISIPQALANALLTGITESQEATANPFRRVFAQAIVSGIRLAEHFAFRPGRIIPYTDVVTGLEEGRDLFSEMVSEWGQMEELGRSGDVSASFWKVDR